MSNETNASEFEETLAILKRVEGGERDAHEALFQRFLPQLERFVAMRWMGDRRSLNQAQDTAQEVALRALRNLPKFQYHGVGSFWAWLRTITLNFLRDEGRKQVRRGPVVDMPSQSHAHPSDHERTPLEVASLRDESESFDRALQCRDERTQRAVLMRVELCIEFEWIAS